MADLSKQSNDFKSAWYALLSELITIDGGGDISSARMLLISDVKVKIDEMMPEGEGVQFSVLDQTNITDTLDLYINALLDESATLLHQVAPIDFIVGKICTTAPVKTDPEDGTGYIELPTDYLRFKSLRMTGWLRDCVELIRPSDPKYKKQGNTVTRGGKAKPVCALSERIISSTLKKVVEYYSLDIGDSHLASKFIYIANVTAENVQANLQPALTWICAAKILEITQRPEEAQKAWAAMDKQFANL
jgi:hypothetical protein